MPSHADDLLEAASALLARRPGQRGRLPGARIRRSISTSYYALFHFLSEEAVARVIGSGNRLRVSRRVLSRVLSHRGIRLAFEKIQGQKIDVSVRDFLSVGVIADSAAPDFARSMARTFLDVQAKRDAADYNLNEDLSEVDALYMQYRVAGAISEWRAADSASDRDFKHALAVLALLRGQLRQD